MGAESMTDFKVASNGHCFFCLEQIKGSKPVSPAHLTSPLATQVNSLQYLTRYLKLDLKKVFVDKSQVSPELLAKIERARLKVELCDECRCLSDKFSEVYRQLEKLELELGSTLSLIHGKLVSADRTEKLQSFTSDQHSNWNGLLDVLDVLRKESIQKSSQKSHGAPRIKIQNLSLKEIKAKQGRLENNFRSNQRTSDPIASYSFVRDYGVNVSRVKLESLNDESLSDNDDENNLSDNVKSYLDESMEYDADTQMEEITSDLNAAINTFTEPTDDKPVVSRTARNMLGTGKYIINPVTGKWKCDACQTESKNYQAFWYHYRSVHLKVRYKCTSCNKLFSKASSLQLHQRTSRSCSTKESTPKFNCHLCEKSYALKHVLQQHLDGAHSTRQKYECDLCEKKYTQYSSLFSHRKQVHGGKK